MKVFNHLEQLIAYGIQKGMIDFEDSDCVRNELWKVIGAEADLDSVEKCTSFDGEIYALLDELVTDAREHGRTLEFLYEVESFQAELMSKLMPRPSELNRQFYEHYENSPNEATDFFYELSMDSTYIRTDRTSKNISWETETDYGKMDITINLSKPEKDPREIALQKNVKAVKYPKCLLCKENVGYKGRVDHPARQNHRIINLTLGGERWYFQYSPYVYYNEHAIVLCETHRNMKIDRMTFVRLCDFVDVFPHYFVGSNADLHTVGGSILSHDHYQAGNYEMPMMRAKSLMTYEPKAYEDVKIDILDWPVSVLRVTSKDRKSLIDISDAILNNWIEYSDEEVDLVAYTDERHNTITPILRKNGEAYELFLALRNNRKSEESPEGIFHVQRKHHHIKRENIGLIEVMGLAVLPSRLVAEMDLVKSCIDETGLNLSKCEQFESLEKHLVWLSEIKPMIDASMQSETALDEVIKAAIGAKFSSALCDAGIYKNKWERMTVFLKEGAKL